MNFIDKKISESYFQIYIILNQKEKQEILTSVKKTILNNKKNNVKDQINIYTNIYKRNHSETTKQKLDNLIQQLNELSFNTININTNELEHQILIELLDKIDEHIDQLKLIQVFNYDFSYIGSLDDNNSITLIYSFCYINQYYKLNLPKEKGQPYIFTNEDIDMIITELMLNKKMYNLVTVDKISEFSDILFTYTHNDTYSYDKQIDINEISYLLNIDKTKLIGLNKGNFEFNNNDNTKIFFNIKEIYDKKLYDINDISAKQLNYLNTTTIIDLKNKIKHIFSLIYNVKSNVFSLIDSMASLNEIHIDRYTYIQYAKYMNYSLKNEYTDKEIKNIKICFLTSYIFFKYNINIDNYLYYIKQEYDVLYKSQRDVKVYTLEQFINAIAPYYALYEFFKSEKLITERS